MGEYFGYEGAYTILAGGVTVTAGAASATVTVPNDSSGNRARLVRLTAKGFVFVKLGHTSSGAVTATTNSMLIAPYSDVVLNCKQINTIAYLESDVGAILNITPLET